MSTVSCSPSTQQSEPLARSDRVRVGFVGAVLALAFLPLLILQAKLTWARPHYELAPLVIVGSVALLFARRDAFRKMTPGRPGVAYALVGFAWLLLAAAELLFSPWLGAVATLGLLLAVLYAIGGVFILRQALPAWAFLWLMLPPPFSLDSIAIQALQSLVTQWGSATLDTFGVYHVVAGNVLQLSSRSIFVEEACSGINSLISVLTCTIFYIFFVRRRFLHTILLIASAVGWVLAANVGRIVAITYLLAVVGIDATEGWRHTSLGFCLFAFALGLIWSTDRLLYLLLSRYGRPPKSPTSKSPSENKVGAPGPGTFSWTSLRTTWLGSLPVAVAFGVLVFFHTFLHGVSAYTASAHVVPAASIFALDASSMPPRFDQWQQDGYKVQKRTKASSEGEFSKIWVYRQGNLVATVALDYPFTAWHRLTQCYMGQGCNVDDETFYQSTPQSNRPGYMEAKLTKLLHRRSFLLYCNLNERGIDLAPSQTERSQSLPERMVGVLGERVQQTKIPKQRTKPLVQNTVYQVQLLVESYRPLTPDEEAKAKALFFQAANVMREVLAKH